MDAADHPEPSEEEISSDHEGSDIDEDEEEQQGGSAAAAAGSTSAAAGSAAAGGSFKSQYRGVSYDRKKGRWRVQIKVRGMYAAPY
jgi:hypothetical protein